MKRDFTKDFGEIQEMCSKIRTINESLAYADEYDEEPEGGFEEQNFGEEQAQQAPVEQPDMQPGAEEDPEDAEIQSELQEDDSPINMIREIALKGMVRLCKTPEDPQYEVLKKVFTMIDKANDKKNEENNV